jgi:oligosaccharide 4-alpha-D-glucosyltransferase
MKNAILFSILFLVSFFSFSQNPNRIYKSHNESNGVFSVQTNDGEYHFKFYSKDILETTFIPQDENEIIESHAVVLKPKNIKTVYKYRGDTISFSSESIKIFVTTKPFQIVYKDQNNEVITSEKKGYYNSKHIPLGLVKDNIVYDKTEKIEFNLTSDEVLFGAGARALGMNRRGYRLPLYNRAHYGYQTHSELMNFTIPLVISSKKYMIHFDNPSIGYLDLDSKNDNSLTYETISGRKTYQVIVGDSWEDLIDNYTDLTGKQPLPPRWVLGNFASRFGYHSQRETEKTIADFKKEDIPLDAVILDLYWFGKTVKGTMGNLEVFKDSFPSMKKMISNFKKQGVKTVLITEPFVLSTSKKWEEANQKEVLAKDTLGNSAKYDFYFGNTSIVDIYKKEGRAWFWNIYKNIHDLGVKGFWGDLGEPEVLPTWVSFGKDKKADELHNVYGHDWAKLIFENYKYHFPNERSFILMRAGYSGSQRFGMIPWSGDVSRSWGGLQSQPEIALQMGMQGLGYMHSDLGGFAGANLDDHLYVRWLQYGVFQPIYRPHAQEDVPSEPVFRSDFAKKHAKKAIELRYKMLPYNYNLAFENNQKGLPLMRPVFFEEDDKMLMTNSSTYLWGKDFLITPILNDSVKTKEVYFPKTSNWFNFYNDELVQGGKTKIVKLKMNSIPTYVRGGVIIPLTKTKQTTDAYKGNQLELHYWYDNSVKESERILYNDDGVTANAFEKGAYELLEFEVEQLKRYLEIDFEAEFGKLWKPQSKQLELVIHNMPVRPKKIKVNGKKISFSNPKNKNTLTIPLLWKTGKEMKVKIYLK